MADLREIREFRRLVANADWPALTMQLLLFATVVYGEKDLQPSRGARTTEQLVRQAIVDVVNGRYGHDLGRRSLFALLCDAVIHLAEEEEAAS